MRQTEVGMDTEANPITAVRRHPVVVVLFALVFGAIGAWFAVDQPESFSSQTEIVVEDARTSTLFTSRSSNAERYVADQIAILKSRVVAERASQLLSSQDPPIAISVDEFRDKTTITANEDSNFITIEFVSTTAQRAQAGAGAIGLAYEMVIQEALAEDAERAVAELDKAIETTVQDIEDLQSQIEDLRTESQDVPATAFLLRQQEDAAALLSELTLQRSQIEVDARLAGNGVAFLAPAAPGVSLDVPTPSVIVLMLALGALIGAGVAYWLSQRGRNFFENRLAPSTILEAPLLAEIPRLSKTSATITDDTALLPILHDPGSPQAEAYRVLVGGLVQRLHETQDESSSKRGLTLAVCSSTLGEGPTVVAVNTALAASQAGLDVALIDGDFGTQDASNLLAGNRSGSESIGLTELVQSQANLGDAVIEIKTRTEGFRTEGSIGLVGRGQGDAAAPEVFGSRETSSLLSQLEEEYDLVIVDLPPVLQVAYATAAVQKANQALVVVCHNSPVDNLGELRYRLDVVGVKALGYVYTNAPSRRSRGFVPRNSPSFDVLGHGSRDNPR